MGRACINGSNAGRIGAVGCLVSIKSVTVTVVPEPESAGLLVVAALLAGRRRRGDGCAVVAG